MGMYAHYLPIGGDELEGLIHKVKWGEMTMSEYLDKRSEDRSAPRKFMLERSWPGIHYILNQDKWGGTTTLKYAVFGEADLGEVVCYYGPVRYLRYPLLSETAGALSLVIREWMETQFNYRQMIDADVIYAGPDFEIYWNEFNRLRDFHLVASPRATAS